MFKMRLALLTGAVVVALIIGALAGVFLTRFIAVGISKPALPAVAVVREIQTLSQLTTVQYVIEKVMVEEDVRWYGENRVLLVAHGVVKAGVDFQRLDPEDIKVSGTALQVSLPPAQLLDVYLDESQTQIIERSTGLLRLFDKDLETVARQHAVMDIGRAARQEGILVEAEERAQTQIRAWMLRLGFEEVNFTSP